MRTFFLLMCSLFSLSASPFDAQWQKVQQAIDDDLPKSAEAVLRTIDTQAREKEAWADAIRARVMILALESKVEEGDTSLLIDALEKELTTCPAEMKPVMRTMQSIWLASYFEENSYEIVQRTAVADDASADFKTWDAKRMMREIDERFTKALLEAEILRDVSLEDYAVLLEKGTMPSEVMPSMYDFLLDKVLRFYEMQDSFEVEAEDAFYILPDSVAFGNTTEFLAWKPQKPAAFSGKIRAIELYQQWLNLRKDSLPARIYIDLKRRAWAKRSVTGERDQTREEKELRSLLVEAKSQPIECCVAQVLAAHLHSLSRSKEAHDFATAAISAHPKSIYAQLCRSMIDTIEQKELRLDTENVWNAAQPEFTATYRNISKLWLRLVPVTWSPEIRSGMDDDDYDALLKKEPTKSWSVDLPPTADYLEREQSLTAPLDVPLGYYCLMVSPREDFSRANNQPYTSIVWRSDLMIAGDGYKSEKGFVVNAVDGKPIGNVKIEQWSRIGDSKWKISNQGKTDSLGKYSLPKAKNNNYVIRAVSGNDQMATTPRWDHTYSNSDKDTLRCYFFTDRAIYRPGQTIRFKAIYARFDSEKNHYRVAKNHKCNVTLEDQNDEKVAEFTGVTNDFGSVSGSFIAPMDRALGNYTLSSARNGYQQFSIEEYKRPKFEVKVGDALTPPQLNKNVTVKASATSYTGAAIDGAKVKWTVTRTTSWPAWCRWCWWYAPSVDSKQIAHGDGVTKADGTLDVSFLAEPDLSEKVENSPIFSYAVEVIVTDTTGESREDTRYVRAAYVDTEASMSADEWQQTDTDVNIAITTKSVDGKAVERKGQIVIHRLIQPEKVQRKSSKRIANFNTLYDPTGQKTKSNEPRDWELGEVIQRNEFSTNAEGKGETSVRLPAGEYRAVLETIDSTGAKVTALWPLRVLDLAAETFPIPVPEHLLVRKNVLEPGEELVVVWGTGYEQGLWYHEISHRGKILRQGWSKRTNTQEVLRFPVTEELRGGFQLRTFFVQQNRIYSKSISLNVPWSKHDLNLKFETMRSKLEPGAKETWSILIDGAKKDQVEMVATLYDASLDAFSSHNWLDEFSGYFYHDGRPDDYNTSSAAAVFHSYSSHLGLWNQATAGLLPKEWSWHQELSMAQYGSGDYNNIFGNDSGGGGSFGGGFSSRKMLAMDSVGDFFSAPNEGVNIASLPPASASIITSGNRAGSLAITRDSIDAILNREEFARSGVGDASSAISKIADEKKLVDAPARKNLQETAFFEPQLTTDEKGIVRLSFTMPEALTTWKFMAFAHDATLRSGVLQGETITAKDLMCQPNPPRFLREGDEIEFTAKVSNLSDQPQKGTARITFADAISLTSRDAELSLQNAEQPFDIPAKESQTISWRIKVPDGSGFLHFKVTAATDKLADGEEGMIPVLARRQLVTESITLPIRDISTREYELKKLIESSTSDTLRHQSVTVEVVSQPAWYAVMALPYLMEYPHGCAEQTFNRWYANQLGRHIAASDPKIGRVFEAWRQAPKTTESPLLKNQELKSLMIEETPWLRHANQETESRRNVGILFDENRLRSESDRALRRLTEMQNANGSWPWFPGGPSNDYITLYLVTGTGRLQQLGIKVDQQHALRALGWLDAQILKRYNEIEAKDRNLNHFDSFVAMYLYGRSFYLKQRPISAANRKAVDYFLGQAKTYWASETSLMTRCHTALGLHRFGNKETPQAILASLRENARNTDELGMHWRANEGDSWNQAPIETQAMIIEAFREISADEKAVNDCQVWLLKQKQTQGWKSTKATADAVYALLLGGANKLASEALVAIKLGGEPVKPENVEPGTGFYQKTFAAAEIKPAMGRVTLEKSDKGVSWGSLHWQYFEDLSKITPHEGNPLEVKKSLFVKRTTAQGETLEALTGAVVPGDELVTRIEIRVDRDMEYVHLKNQRGSGTEPMNVLSGYRWQGGLGFYEMTKDTADHFFIERLPRGTYVFETSSKMQLRGKYPSGIAEIQCMYAPEFNSHSASTMIEVK